MRARALWLLWLLAGSAGAAAPAIPWQFAGTYDYHQQAITFAGEPTGLFRAGERVRLVVADGSPVRVYDRHATLVYAGGATNRTWQPGFYFVESATDRNTFTVLPRGYDRLPHLGGDCVVVTNEVQEIKFVAAGLGWTRGSFFWDGNTTTNMTWGQYDFTLLNNQLNYARDTRRKFILQLAYWPAYLHSIREQSAARYAQYVNDVTRYVAAHSNGTWCAAVTLWNEPYPTGKLQSHVTESLLAEIYAAAIPVIRRNLPRALIAGGNNMNFGYAFGMLPRLRVAGAPLMECTAVGHHDYDCVSRPDEPLFEKQTLDEKLTRLESFFPPGAAVLIDEMAVYGGRLAEGAPVDVLGIPLTGDNPTTRGSYNCGDWDAMFCDLAKQAVIFRRHQAVLIGHQTFSGSHDAFLINNSYAGWFPGVRTNQQWRTRGPRPGLASFLAANHWLVGGTYRATIHRGNLWEYEFEQADGSRRRFTWTIRGTTLNLPRTTEWTRTDLFGNPLLGDQITAEPILRWFAP